MRAFLEEKERYPDWTLTDDSFWVPVQIPSAKAEWVMRVAAEYDDVQEYLQGLVDAAEMAKPPKFVIKLKSGAYAAKNFSRVTNKAMADKFETEADALAAAQMYEGATIEPTHVPIHLPDDGDE